MSEFDGSKVRVGDEVAIPYGSGPNIDYRFTEVTHITPTGLIRVDGLPETLFTSGGWMRGRRWSGPRLVRVTDEIREHVRQKALRDPVYRFLRDLTRDQLHAATTEQLTTAARALGWKEPGNG